MSATAVSEAGSVASSGKTSFDAFIIGQTTLPIQCAEILLEKGHRVSGIISSDPEVAHWAEDKEIDCFDPAGDLFGVLSRRSFEYLFSINNLTVLGAELLRLPRKLSINFHDGPLPRYAGLNAASWAILNHETSHGVTWHIMTGDAVDTGDILSEQAIEISLQETALSLNAKCYEAGIRAFQVLVEGLASGTMRPRRQDLAGRTYFPRSRRPPAGCILRWDQPAEELSALVRGLEFGGYPNPMGVPKMAVGSGLVVVARLEIVEASGAPPGTITKITHDSIRVATASGDVLLREFRGIDGQRFPARMVVEPNELMEGSGLPILDEREAVALNELHESLAPHEDFWVRELTGLEPLLVPYARHGMAEARSPRYARDRLAIPARIQAWLRALPGAEERADAMLAALVVYLSRIGGKMMFSVGLRPEPLGDQIPAYGNLVTPTVPLRIKVEPARTFQENWNRLREQLRLVREHRAYLSDLRLRYPDLQQAPSALPVVLGEMLEEEMPVGTQLALAVSGDLDGVEWLYPEDILSRQDLASMQRQFVQFLDAVAGDDGRPVGQLALLDREQEQRVLIEWNDTDMPYDLGLCVHHLFEAQAIKTPEAVALIGDGRRLTYRELDRKANQLANYLSGLGIGPESRVGICMERSPEMMVALLGTLKAGAAYVPIDPAYPAMRTRFIIDDAQVPVIVSNERPASTLPAHAARVVRLDADAASISRQSQERVVSDVTSDNLAYVLYTSGSTGTPKGVMVTHRNVVNFLHAMDERVDHDPPGVWLAVTSISFDISVLELFWTLARGFEVVIFSGNETEHPREVRPRAVRDEIDFSLMYFGSGEGPSPTDKYRLLLEGARFADENGFSALWTPERHFHAFGGLYPNPSVTSAAIAAITRRIKIRAGSCVSPLHNPVRIAEEWSVVDNLSGGRVGISFASGWQPDDFVLAPENFTPRKEVMLRQIDIVRRLWRGESISLPGPLGKEVLVQILPHPIQPDLPVWITSAGNPETFRMAGEAGYFVLTHLLGQSLEEVAEKIRTYRDAWRAGGHGPDGGHVTLMLHTFVGETDDAVREAVRAPMKEYLRSSVGLIQKAAWTFPAFKQATADAEGRFALDHLSEEELNAVLDFSFERYFETSGLFGAPRTCLRLIDWLVEIGVDEIACLIDFHESPDVVLAHLPPLNEIRMAAGSRTIRAGPEGATLHPIAGLIEQHRVTHLQCTPSMAGLVLSNPGSAPAFRSLRQLLVGGEAFPAALARELRQVVTGSILNMYGPTETTIWSSTFEFRANEDPPGAETVPIGRPIGNTRFYVVDPELQPVPAGISGELFIGGDGVARGYLNRPELTAQRFVDDPFTNLPGSRLYRTGDLVRYRTDATLEFLGRVDNQVKIRGYRVELGEIESVLSSHPALRENAVVLRSDRNGSERLMAYVVARDHLIPSAAELRAYVAEILPDYMLPAAFETLVALPRTPNGKVDRAALPEPSERRTGGKQPYLAPRDDLERELAAIWESELRVQPIGVNDNFFDLGGHSLLAMRVFNLIEKSLGKRLPLATLFEAPTVEQLAAILRQGHWAPRWSTLVEIQPAGSRPPFFCIHGHGGHVLLYYNLARSLGSDQPFYGIQAVGLDGERPPYTRFEDMARHYIDEIRSVQSKGPYFVGGDCLGGAVAYEVARQLRERGEEVALLAMFDAFRPGYPQLLPFVPLSVYKSLHRTRILGFHLATLLRLGPEKAARYVVEGAQRASFAVAGRLGDLVGKRSPLLTTQAALKEALRTYDPPPYSGKITLIRGTKLPAGIRACPDMGWAELAKGGIEVLELPSYVTTAVSGRNVEILAERLKGCIDLRIEDLKLKAVGLRRAV